MKLGLICCFQKNSGMASHIKSALQSTGMTTHLSHGKCMPSTTRSTFRKKPCSFGKYLNCSRVPPVWRCAASAPSGKDVIERVGPFNEMELPPLLASIVVPGLAPPPVQASLSRLQEAEERLMKLAERWNLQSFTYWTQPGISFTNGVYGGTISTDRFVVIAIINTLNFMLDDLFFDAPNEVVLEESGISSSISESPHSIGAFLKRINDLLRQEEPLDENPTPVEGVVWELGQEMRRLSNPEWFEVFATQLMEHHEAGVRSHADRIAGNSLFVNGLDAFTQMRVDNSGGRWVMLVVEFANNVYLQGESRAHPTLQQLTNAAVLHCMCVNDLFSFAKEVVDEGNPRNILKMLMEKSQGGSGLPQAAWKAVDLINSHTHSITELEKKFDLEGESTWAFAMRSYIDGVKSVMTGNLYWHSVDQRYRHAESVFPELRGIANVHKYGKYDPIC